MLFATIVTLLIVGSVYGAGSSLTIYSTNHKCIAQNYPQYMHSSYGGLLIPWGSHVTVPGIHAAGMNSMFYEFIPTLRNIYDRPFVLVSRSQDGSNKMSACLVKDGLVSFTENYCSRHVQEALQAGKEKKAFLFYPQSFDIRRLYPVKNMTVGKFEIPRDIKLKNLVNLFSSGMPYLLVQDATAFDHNIRTWDLVEIAELDKHMRPVTAYQTNRLARMIQERNSEESSEESSKRPHHHSTSTSQRPYHQHSTSTSQRPHHQYSTSTSSSSSSSSSEESSEHTRYPWQTSSTTRRYLYT